MLKALIEDKGLDSFELSILYWFHGKYRIYERAGIDLDRTDFHKYEELKIRFLNYGVCESLLTIESQDIGLSASKQTNPKTLDDRINAETAPHDKVETVRPENKRQLEFGLAEMERKGVIYFQDDKGKKIEGLDPDGLMKLAELQLKTKFGFILTESEEQDVITKTRLINQYDHLGDRIRDIKKSEHNGAFAAQENEFFVDCLALSIPPPMAMLSSETIGSTPTPIELLHLKIHDPDSNHCDEMSKTFGEDFLPIPLSKRPANEQRVLHKEETPYDQELQNLIANTSLGVPTGNIDTRQSSYSTKQSYRLMGTTLSQQDREMEYAIQSMIKELDQATITLSSDSRKISLQDEETKWANASVEATPKECFYMDMTQEAPIQEENEIAEDEVLELPSKMDFNKMKFIETMRCRLCGCNVMEAHSPAMYKSCTFFKGQLPQPIQQNCCGGFHAAVIQGTICPVVTALGSRSIKTNKTQKRKKKKPKLKNLTRMKFTEHIRCMLCACNAEEAPVSYTHLTLPTKA